MLLGPFFILRTYAIQTGASGVGLCVGTVVASSLFGENLEYCCNLLSPISVPEYKPQAHTSIFPKQYVVIQFNEIPHGIKPKLFCWPAFLSRLLTLGKGGRRCDFQFAC